MALYRYKAATTSGEVVEGEMEASSQDAVIKRLQSQGNVPIRAEEITAAALSSTRKSFSFLQRRTVSRQELAIFTTELGTLLKAGLPIDKALDMLSNLAVDGPLFHVLSKIRTAVREGESLSEAMRAQQGVFSRFYLNMVRAGESSGALDHALERMSEFMERSRELRETIVSALVYPVILLFVAGLSLTIILGYVVPRITDMFTDAGQQLPWMTRVVVACGDFVQTYWWVIAGVVLLIAIVVRRQYAVPETRLRWDGVFLKMPLFGELIAKVEAARFTRTLGTLLGNGVPLLDAMAIAKEIVANQAVAAGIGRVSSSVRKGEGLAKPLLVEDIFPRLAAHLMQVGEETGNLEEMLVHLADIYERDVKTTVERVMSIIGPVMILVLGAVIAAIIMSIVMAMLSVNELAF